MLKETIRKCIQNYQVELIKVLEKQYNDQKDAAGIDENDVKDADTHSHQVQAQMEEQRIGDRLESAITALNYLESILVTESRKVTEGALIETDNLLIYVGINTQKFTEDGRDIIGISTKAPIYKILHNQKNGFPFQFAGTDCEIISIQ